MDSERLDYLLQRYFDQLLTSEEWNELEQSIRESRKAREAFWEQARWHSAIRSWGQEEWGRRTAFNTELRVLPRPKVVQNRPKTVIQPKWQRWALAAAAMVVVGTMWLMFGPQEHAPALGVAVLTQNSSAIWENQASFHAGQSLQPTTLFLKSGAFQLDFARGARVIIEGPAEFSLINDNEGFLKYGKLRAHVPEPAHGFKVSTPSLAAVDLGTEFACLVPKTGSEEVHVFVGEIKVQAPLARLTDKELHQTEALRIEGEKVQSIPANPRAFLSEEELAQIEMKNARGGLAAWNLSSQLMAQNPDTVLYLNFEAENTWTRTLHNLSVNAMPGTDATIIGTEWVDGRWPGKHALEFQGDEDRVRVSVPMELPSFTMMAWIRVDNLPHYQSSLLMGESFQVGEVHWYLYKDGQIGLGISRGGNEGWAILQSTPVIRPDMFGSWVFVTTVFDGSTRTATHYLNGQQVASGLMQTRSAPRLDTFEIGNYGIRPNDPRLSNRGPGGADRNLRSFHGRIDEMAIFSVPLPASEIQRLYSTGAPEKR